MNSSEKEILDSVIASVGVLKLLARFQPALAKKYIAKHVSLITKANLQYMRVNMTPHDYVMLISLINKSQIDVRIKRKGRLA
jgi:hypothetical protein